MKKPINNFFCPHSVYEDEKFKKLKISSRHLYTILCKIANRHAESDGWFWRSIKQLANDSGLSSKSVVEAKKELAENSFIDIKRGYYKHSRLRSYDYFRLNGFRFKM